MNQILEDKKRRLFHKTLYLFQFYILIIILFIIILYLFFRNYIFLYQKEIANITSKSYSLTQLYSDTLQENIKADNSIISILGIIKIPNINISYPILSECTDNSLKISVCKFYGPKLNEIGNFCILGHNYNNNDFFSNLKELKINNQFYIYDLENNKTTYQIYQIYEIGSDNLEYLSQNTYRKERNNLSYLY